MGKCFDVGHTKKSKIGQEGCWVGSGLLISWLSSGPLHTSTAPAEERLRLPFSHLSLFKFLKIRRVESMGGVKFVVFFLLSSTPYFEEMVIINTL